MIRHVSRLVHSQSFRLGYNPLLKANRESPVPLIRQPGMAFDNASDPNDLSSVRLPDAMENPEYNE